MGRLNIIYQGLNIGTVLKERRKKIIQDNHVCLQEVVGVGNKCNLRYHICNFLSEQFN